MAADKRAQDRVTRSKALRNHLQRAIKNAHPHIQFVPTDKLGEWYFIMGVRAGAVGNEGEFLGADDEFAGGQYIGILKATAEYPYGPPDAEMLTPTGVFPLNSSDFCIDIGKYHANQYPAGLGLDGFCGMILAGLIGWRELGGGIALFKSGDPRKDISIITKLARASRDYNLKHNKRILDMFIEANLERAMQDMAIVENAPTPAPAPALAPAPLPTPTPQLSEKELRIRQKREQLAAARAAAAAAAALEKKE